MKTVLHVNVRNIEKVEKRFGLYSRLILRNPKYYNSEFIYTYSPAV